MENDEWWKSMWTIVIISLQILKAPNLGAFFMWLKIAYFTWKKTRFR